MDAREHPPAETGLDEQIRAIRANAELVVSMLARETDFVFGFNEESVQWLDNYIEYIRESPWTDEEFKQIVSNLGAFLGEAIIAAFGGAWAFDLRGWAVRWDEDNCAYPFNKVAKQMTNGVVDSIYSFYSVTGALHRF